MESLVDGVIYANGKGCESCGALFTVICSTLLVLIPACVAKSTFRFGCIFGRFACGAIGTNRLSFRALVHSMIAFRATGGTDIRRVVPLRACFAFEKCLIAKPTRRALIAPKVGSTRSAVKQRRRNPNGRSHRSRILRRVQLARVATGTTKARAFGPIHGTRAHRVGTVFRIQDEGRPPPTTFEHFPRLAPFASLAMLRRFVEPELIRIKHAADCKVQHRIAAAALNTIYGRALNPGRVDHIAGRVSHGTGGETDVSLG